MKYFVFNKPMDYQRGYLENLVCTEHGIQLLKGGQKGVFFSRVLDSGEKEMAWHRMTCAIPVFRTGVHFWIYSAETNEMMWNGTITSIERILQEQLTAAEKRKILSPFLKKEFLNETDVLLHDIKGRYIWFCIEIYSGQEENVGIENMFLYFPAKNWLHYLPSVYEKNRESAAFLDQYLSIFQSIYDDFNQRFENSSALLEPAVTEMDFLQFMAEWLNIVNTNIWSEDKLRNLIRMAPAVFRKRGTRQGLLDVIELFTGEPPLIIEQWKIREYRKYSDKKEFLDQLYGTDENTFLILVKEKYCSGKREQEALLNLIQEVSPAHMEARLVALRQYMILGEHTYLGVNSGLGYYKPTRLDGLSLVSLTSIGKQE